MYRLNFVWFQASPEMFVKKIFRRTYINSKREGKINSIVIEIMKIIHSADKLWEFHSDIWEIHLKKNFISGSFVFWMP